ncbi:MAG: TRAP transporter TatT component family protein [Halofilum sp. (in: g-proteobacteria)]|nr:TRAP transporter TatT component family protein [Halofilum sp. (in: g-proteobacteria)]
MRATATVGGLLAATVLLAGCATPSGIADDLGTAMASQRDPQVVRDGGPAYLIMVDALVRDAPDDARIHLVAARLYSAYAGGFVDAPERQLRLTQQALDYGTRGLCLSLERLCGVHSMRFDAFRAALSETVDDAGSATILYRFAAAWAGWIQARSGDYRALAELPKLEAAFERVLALAPEIDHGQAHVYLGVLQAQRPASLGGQPQSARDHFQRAIEVSGDRNLMAKTLYAEHYARLVFDRELHDRLLTEVVEADPAAGDLTLANVLAQERARELLASADDYF